MRILVWFSITMLCAACNVAPPAIEPATADHHLAVVFDIDGTLTTNVNAINDTRPGAVAAVQAWADAGYRIIYLSARHPMFQWHIPGWLERNGFPAGAVHVTENSDQRRDHAAFKRGVLEAYRDSGWGLAAAYGDSTTDFEAYAAAGIARDHVFALKRKGAESCEPGIWAECFATWVEQMAQIPEIVTQNR